MQKQRGFTLIETLLALAIAAVLITLSLQRYQHYQRQTALLSLQSNIDQAKLALNNYFYQQSKDEHGVLRGDLVPTSQQLGLKVSGYGFEIIAANKKTIDEKPIYQLRMQLQLNPQLSTAQVEWYKNYFAATRSEGHALEWSWLPAAQGSVVQDKFWGMRGRWI